jgi:hypothetical protein
VRKVAIDAMRGIVKKVLVSIGIDINREIEGVTLEDLKNISGKS